MTEQFLLRFGVNMQAVTTGLQKTSSQIKAWGVSTIAYFKEYGTKMLAGFAAGFAIDKILERASAYLEKINERVILVKRTMADLGVSSNFAQGIFGALGFAGLDPESASMPLKKFSVLIGQAKFGMIEARQKLVEWGLAVKNENWNIYNLQNGLGKLRERFQNLGDAQKRSAMLADIMGQGFASVIPILEMTDAQFKKLDESNFIKKLTPEAIDLFQGIRIAKKKGSAALPIMAGNSLEFLYRNGIFGGGGGMMTVRILELMGASGEKTNEQISEGNMLEKERIELKKKELDLENKIRDAGKLSIASLASEARAKTGIAAPRYYGVSQRMREAMRIDTLERKADNAFRRGDDEGFSRLRGEAAQMRKAATWASAADQNPMAQMEYELKAIKDKVSVISELTNEVKGQMSSPR